LEINEKLIQLYGVQQSKRKWGSTLWTTTGGVSVMPFGSNQSMRGLKVGKDRPSLVIIDDFENDENVETPEQRDKLWKRLFAVIKPMMRSAGETKIVYLGTAVHEDCILYRLMDLLRKNPAPHICVVEQGAKDDNGESVWPEWKSTEELNEDERLYAEAGQLDTFYQEYYCKVIASKDASFPKDRVVYYDEQNTPDDCRTWMTIDCAFSKAKTADYSAVVVFSTSMDAKAVLVREAIRGRMKPDEFLKLLVMLNETYRPLRVFIQGVLLDEFFQFYANECDTRLPFEKVKLSQKRNAKFRRISSLQPLYIGGRLQFLRRHTDLLGELWMHPRSKHDDLKDALATGVSKVTIPAIGKIERPELEQGSFEFILRMNDLAQRKQMPDMGLTFMPPGQVEDKWKYH
jgi:phage terminase large subunit-like protein